jgi:phosphate transport system substrate-binding protein
MKRSHAALIGSGALATTLALAAASNPQDNLARLRGAIKIDGSSTVYPITQAVAEEFRTAAPSVEVTVGISGTGGGFKRFAIGEIDISDASRPIKKEEHDKAVESGVEYIEVPVAYDGLSIVVHPKNDWCTTLTVDELKKIYLDGGAKTWAEVRAGWPNTPIKVYSPGTDSGTFDYFKEVVAGDKAMRSDMSVSEDDNVLVTGVSGDVGAIGYFGCAYYFENKDKINVVQIVNPKLNTPVAPSTETIVDGSYAPFSRPLFIYINKKSMQRPEVKGFIGFYLEHAADLAEEVGYVQLPTVVYDRARANVRNGRTGTQYLNDKGEKVSGPVTEVYR